MNQPLKKGSALPDISLLGTDGLIHNVAAEYKGSRAFVIFFTCNHCPYVKGSDAYNKELYANFHPKGVAFVAINSNDDKAYPEDSFKKMAERVTKEELPWLYLHDPSQNLAKRFGAICTPHYFLFNQQKMLVYNGRALDNPKGGKAKSRHEELKDAIIETLEHKPVSIPETDPVGCSVKWHV